MTRYHMTGGSSGSSKPPQHGINVNDDQQDTQRWFSNPNRNWPGMPPEAGQLSGLVSSSIQNSSSLLPMSLQNRNIQHEFSPLTNTDIFSTRYESKLQQGISDTLSSGVTGLESGREEKATYESYGDGFEDNSFIADPEATLQERMDKLRSPHGRIGSMNIYSIESTTVDMKSEHNEDLGLNELQEPISRSSSELVHVPTTPLEYSQRDSSSLSVSWTTLTPLTLSDQPSRSNTQSVTLETAAPVQSFGPSKEWYLPPRKRQRKSRKHQPNADRKRVPSINRSKSQRRRGAFNDEKTREMTAMTRELKACIRCRRDRKRCEIDPSNPRGPCLTCHLLSAPLASGIPCLRDKITDSFLYREQSAPSQFFTKRWNSMEIKEITGWASSEIKTIRVTQGFNASYEIEVRKFTPVDGDVLEKFWNDKGVVKSHKIPPYGVADMNKAAHILRKFIEGCVGAYITGMIDYSDDLLWNTYLMAFKHSVEAQTSEEKVMLTYALRLWSAARKTSNSEWLCGDETLGTPKVMDQSSPYNMRRPIPPLINAQFQVISYSTLLRPFSKAVLDKLQNLITANKRKYWLTIYLTLFILLHSCSMITRRNAQYARQLSLKSRFADPVGIAKHHRGALTILAHFHYCCNRGTQPFTKALDPSGLLKFAEDAELNEKQVRFVKDTAMWVKAREFQMKKAREELDFGNDFYFVSQLFDEDWKPTDTA